MRQQWQQCPQFKVGDTAIYDRTGLGKRGEIWSVVIVEVEVRRQTHREADYLVRFDGIVVPERFRKGQPGPQDNEYMWVYEEQLMSRKPRSDDQMLERAWQRKVVECSDAKDMIQLRLVAQWEALKGQTQGTVPVTALGPVPVPVPVTVPVTALGPVPFTQLCWRDGDHCDREHHSTLSTSES